MKGQKGYVDESQLQKVNTEQQPLTKDDSGSSVNGSHQKPQYIEQSTVDPLDSDKNFATKRNPQLTVNQQIVNSSGSTDDKFTPNSNNDTNSNNGTNGTSEFDSFSNYGFSLALSRSNSADNTRNSIESTDTKQVPPIAQNELDLFSQAHLSVMNAGQYEKVVTEMNILDFIRYMPKVNLRSLSSGKYVAPSKNYEVLKVMTTKPNNSTQHQILWVNEPSQNGVSQPEKVAFRTFYHRFWSATHSGKLLPDCEKSLPGPHEMFTIVPCNFVDRSVILMAKPRKNSDNKPPNGNVESCVALMTSNGTFAGLEWGADGDSQLACVAKVLTVNELFQPLSQIGFKLNNDSFLSCTNYKKLSTRSTRLGHHEVFTIAFENNGLSIVTCCNTYLSAEIDGNVSAKTPADPSRRSAQEIFQIEVYRIPHKFGDLKFALKTCYNNYVRVDVKANAVKADKPTLDENCLFIFRAARLGSLTEFMQESPLRGLVTGKNGASLMSSTDSNENFETNTAPPKSSAKSIPKKLRDSWLSLFASESHDDEDTGVRYPSYATGSSGTSSTGYVPSARSSISPQSYVISLSPQKNSPKPAYSTHPTTRDAYNQPDTLLVGVNPDKTPASDLRKFDASPLHEIEDQWKIQWNELKFTRRVLGMGFFGKVMEGSNKDDTEANYRTATWRGTQVACKFIYRENFRTKNEFDLFLHEVKMMTILRHPCICQFLGIAFNDKAYCIVTELLYCSLFDLVREDIYLLHSLPKLRWTIAYNIAQGVCYMHSRNPPILHRDLSSKNVLLQHVSLNAKVADFGLSRAKSDKMSVGTGALQWMAPEVFKGSKYTESCDVFSFAIILYELWTGDDPCAEVCQHTEDGEYNLTEYAFKISSGVRPSLPPTIPLCWQSLIQACWHPNPDSRPPFTKVIEILDTFPEASAENVSLSNLTGSYVRNLPPFLQQALTNNPQGNNNGVIMLDRSSASTTDTYQQTPQSIHNFPETSSQNTSGSSVDSHYYGENVPPYLVLDPLVSTSSSSGSAYTEDSQM